MIPRTWKSTAVVATAFVGSMMVSTPAPAQMADMCGLVANEMCRESTEFSDYDTCFAFYYRQYCPDWSEPACLTDPVTMRTICF